MSIDPAPPHAATVPEWFRDQIEGFERWVSHLTPVDFALIALGAFALGWIFASIRAVTRLGPIEVEPLEHDGETKDQGEIKALTAKLREQLAKSGLAPPTEVPASTPQTDLISAIEASNIPQGAWIAKVLEMLPKPPSPTRYRLSATLIGKPGSEACGISFWLRPSRAGSELLDTVKNKPSHEAAVECAAAKIFVHISNDAVYVFPSWARWRTSDALELYLKGVQERADSNHAIARVLFERARKEEPRNLLARMQIASLDEREAGTRAVGNATPLAPNRGPVWPGGARNSRRMVVRGIRQAAYVVQARALGRYLETAIERPTLVEARYRASILSGVLAAWCNKPEANARNRDRLIRTIGLHDVNPNGVERKLREIADDESKAVHVLLKRWHVLFREGRLRNRYEPRGVHRKELKRAASITTHCLRVRRHTDAGDFGSWAGAGLARRRISVRLWHLMPGASRGWQAHYNAGCFYALLHEREQKRKPTGREIAVVRRLRRIPLVRRILRLRKPYRIGRMRRLRERAYKHLSLASEEGREKLDAQWLAKGDPDLDSLRTAKERAWTLLLSRHRGTLTRTPEIHEVPDSPWGKPSLRRGRWLTLAAMIAAGTVIVATVLREPLVLLGLLATAFAGWRSWVARQEGTTQDAAGA